MKDDSIKMITMIVSCFFSVFFNASFLCFYIRFGQIRNNFASQLILILSICDLLCWGQSLLMNLYLLFTDQTVYDFQDSLCISLAFLMNLSSMTIMITIFLISFSIYLSTVKNIVITDHKFKLYFSAIFFIIILSALPFITNDYGKADSMLCWIVGKPMSFFSYYLVIWVIFLIDFYFIARTLYVIKKLPIVEHLKIKLKRHLILFPLIFIFSYSAGFLNSFIGLFYEKGIFWLGIVDYVLEPMDGVLNPLAYMLINDKVRNGIKSFLCFQKKNSKKKEENDDSKIESILNSEDSDEERKNSGATSANAN